MNDTEIAKAVELLRSLSCQDPKIIPEERVTRDMAFDAGDLSLEGSIYRQEQFERCGSCPVCFAQQILLHLATQYLSIKAMPEEKKDICVLSNKDLETTGKLIEGRTIEGWQNKGYNQARHEMLLAIVKLMS
jgi:hypothetical protein